MRARQVAAAVAVMAGVATAMTGCSQVDSLKQVSGVPINTLQIAVGTVLVNNKVPILVAPNCLEVDNDSTKFECKGKTTTGEEIVATGTAGASNNFTLSPGGTPTPVPNGTLQLPMVVKVGGKVIYEGQAQAVIDMSQGGAK
ncbi:MAG TPA: hypothetical protein DCQ04_16180 [Actinobacteria bacterium]|nr:hypothetical protein [Actinomycetota bacterium]